MRHNITDYLLLLFLALVWSSAFLLIKVGVQSVGPFTLTGARLGLAALLFLGFLAVRREWIPMHRGALLFYAVVGVVGHSLPFLLISLGETRISSSLTALLMGIMPITTFVLAHIFIAEEPLTRRRALGVGLGFSGLIVLMGLSALAGLGDQALAQLSVLGGAMCYGASAVFVRLHPPSHHYRMAAGATITAALVSIPLAFVFESPLDMRPTAASIQAIVVLAVVPTALASVILLRVIAALGATVFSQVNYVIPVLGALWGILFLGESLRWNVFAAFTLVLVGVYLVQSGARGSRDNAR